MILCIILYKYLQQPYEEMEIFQAVQTYTKEQLSTILHPRIILCTIYNFVQHTYAFSFSVVSYYLELTLDLLFVKSHHDASYNSIGYPKPPVYMIHIVFPHTYIQHQKLFHARREKELCKIAWKINTFSF